MKLSIIITTRNRKNDLLECVNSIKRSKLLNFDWELIVVDDNSNDGTEKIKIEGLEIENGLVVHNETQQMMVKSRNIGVKNSTGKYILFIDDDNIIDEDMIKKLVDFADNNEKYGIVGPSMYYLKERKKYLDYQKINFFTGKTSGVIDNSNGKICKSDGIPNVFLIRREVFKKCGLFDESLIQTFTEPDFAFNAKRFGYKCGIIKEAKTYHNVGSGLSDRCLGGEFKQKAYCLMRNRSLIIARYGKIYHKIIYIIFFSWFWPLLYSFLILREKRIDLVKLYWLGFKDGFIYFFTGKLNNSLV
ncbi:MAG: glycosyltransferase family 2 protein [Patescibacteria group bacterium]